MSAKSFIKKIVASAACVATLAVPFTTSVSAASTDVVYAKNSLKNTLSNQFDDACRNGKGYAYNSYYDNYTVLNNARKGANVIGITVDGSVGGTCTASEAFDYFLGGGTGSIYHLGCVNVHYLLGDVNFDRVVDNKDYTIIKNYVMKKSSLSLKQLALADINNDNMISITDLSYLSLYIG